MTLVSQSISKSTLESDRPGWIRCNHKEDALNINTEYIQNGSSRKPSLWVEAVDGTANTNLEIKEKTLNYIVAPVVTSDIMNGITCKDYLEK